MRSPTLFSRRRAVEARGWLLATVCALLLSACVLQPARPQGPRPLRQQIEQFSFSGGAVAWQGEKAWRVGLNWQHRPERDEVLLTGPLGQGLAQIVREGAAARLTTADHKQYRAEQADDLAREVLGLPLPVSALPRWLVGDLAHAEPDALGRPLRGQEAGWQIEYLEYETEAADALPRRLKLQQGEYSLTLRIDTWDLE